MSYIRSVQALTARAIDAVVGREKPIVLRNLQGALVPPVAPKGFDLLPRATFGDLLNSRSDFVRLFFSPPLYRRVFGWDLTKES